MMKELTNDAYNAYKLLKRAGFLMENFPEDVSDEKIEKICYELSNYLKERN